MKLNVDHEFKYVQLSGWKNRYSINNKEEILDYYHDAKIYHSSPKNDFIQLYFQFI